MKKFIFVLFLTLGVVSSQAQFKWGFTGGVNTSKLSYKDIPGGKSSSRTGWYFGPKAQVMIPAVGLGVNVAAEYSQRRLNTNGDGKTYRSFEIPVNLRYQLGISLAKVYVQTGPQFGFQLGSNNWNVGNSTSLQLKKSNVTWNVGAGVVLVKHLELGVGYNFGVSKCAKLLGNQGGSIKANTFQVQASYLF